MGEGTPTNTLGRKKRLAVSMMMVATGAIPRLSTGPERTRRSARLPAVENAASIRIQATDRSPSESLRSAIRPPIQLPTEKPARTTAITAVHV